MDYLTKEIIVNDMFTISGLPIVEYETFFKKAMDSIEEDFELMRKRFIGSFRHNYKSEIINETHLEAVKNNLITQSERRAYVQGYNECQKKHKEIMNSISEIVESTILKSFDLKN